MTTRRDLPSVDKVMRSLPSDLPRLLASEIARAAVEQARSAIDTGGDSDAVGIADRAAARLLERRPKTVINATGVLLHTNLGRAPLDRHAAEAARAAAVGYGNLEMQLDTGKRGGRGAHALELIRALTGAEAALIVNNNAGALFLALIALAAGRSVPVSRGELIEIGTTNRTRVGDYQRACDESTAMLLKVHPSNYRIEGFAEEATLTQLAALGAERRLPLVFDAGSGLLDARTPWLEGPPPRWLAGEPGVAQSIGAGADLVMFSGDKLLGGPQAGIVVGRADLVARLRTHPVTRAMRIDGPSLVALGLTLERYADGTAHRLPFWAMATATHETLLARCERVLAEAGLTDAAVETRSSTVGAGSVPGSEVPSPVIVIGGDTDRRYLALLAAVSPVVGRREAGSLVIDLRAVFEDDDATVAAALAETCRS
ncbi:MAG: L-seryl-tRNA(Sec) selenium transferase [Acidimicrobiia bacterium]